jgi:hypothetical protein
MPVRFSTNHFFRRPTAATIVAAATMLAVSGCVHRGAPAPSLTSAHRAHAGARPAATTTVSASAMGAGSSGSAGRLSRAALLRSAPAGTYILDVLSVQGFEVVRWPEHVDAPLRVYIGEGSKLAGWRPTFPAMVRSAFTEWCTLGIPLRVVFVSDSSKAQVRVNWVDHFGQDVSGRTTWQYDDAGRIRAGRTTLSTRRADGTPRTDAQLRAIALHEVGHAIGLQHVQGDQTSIMAPRVDVFELSSADRATARLLYSLPPGKLQ